MSEKLKENKAVVATVTFTMDGKEFTVPKGTTVLEAAKENNINIPTFCWHPKLKSIGACRMCYVEVEKMPKLQVSCMLEAMEGMVVLTDSDQVRQGRRAIIEFILANHPLDCPTCDKGGECDLQDQTFAHGYDDSRFEFSKNRFVDDDMTTTFDDRKIGPEIVLNRNRCILCYKCVRSNKEAFGEYDLGAYERGNITEINSAPGEQVDNPFSGNLVEICPVGALTNSDWRYKIRVWNTKTSPSVCPFNSSGSNIDFYKEDHKNKIYRVTSRPNDNIDDGWISDVTRYGYQIIGAEDRLKKPLVKKDGKQVEVSWEEAIEVINKRCSDIKEKMGSVCIGGLIAPHFDNRSLYSFSKFIRTVLKSNNVDFRGDYRMLPDKADTAFGILRSQPFSISDIDDSDVIVVFGSDLIREHANEYLRIRKAYYNNAAIYSLNPYAVKSADVANLEIVYTPGTDEAVINGIGLAAIDESLIDSAVAEEFKKNVTPSTLADNAKLAGVEADDLKLIAHALYEGKKISFIIGELVTRSRERDRIASAICNLNILFEISQNGQIAILARYSNSKGAEKLGLLPSPSDEIKNKLNELWNEYPDCAPKTTDAMMAQIKKEEIKGFFIFGSNPLMLYPDREFVKEALEKLDFLVAADLFENEITTMADVVLPLAGWAEYAGAFINLEGRCQPFEKAVKPAGGSKPIYDIIKAIAGKFDANQFKTEQLDSEIDSILKVNTTFDMPDKFIEITTINENSDNSAEYPYPVFIVDDPHHCGHLTERAPSLNSFAGEAYVEMSYELASKNNIKNGDLIRLESELSKLILPVKISDIIDTDVFLIPRNFSATPVNAMFMRKKRVDRVKITRVED